jgi:protein TonB
MATRTPLLDYYEILGLPRDAEAADIEAAFKSEMLRVRDLPGSGERTRRIGLAYRALSNPERRRDYDAALSGTPVPTSSESAEAEDWPIRAEDSQASPAPAFFEDEREQVEPRRSHRPALLLVLAAAALLLLAGLWVGSLFSTDPKIAEAGAGADDTSPAAAGAPGERPATGDEGLLDRFGSLIAPDAPEQAQLETPASPASTAVVSNDIQAVPAQDAPDASNGSVPSDDAAPTNDAAPAATEPTPSPPQAAEQARQEAPPAPAPAPAVNRSTGPRLVSGGLLNSDNQGGRFQGTVGVRLSVGPNGRAQSCSVTRSSGNAALDSTTCRLLQERLQFSPARDRDGNPISTEVESTHVWGRQRRR